MSMIELPGSVIEEALRELGINKAQAARLGNTSRKTLGNIFLNRTKSTTKIAFLRALTLENVMIEKTQSYRKYAHEGENVLTLPIGTSSVNVALQFEAEEADKTEVPDEAWFKVENAFRELCALVAPFADEALRNPDYKDRLQTRFAEHYFRQLRDKMLALGVE